MINCSDNPIGVFHHFHLTGVVLFISPPAPEYKCKFCGDRRYTHTNEFAIFSDSNHIKSINP